MDVGTSHWRLAKKATPLLVRLQSAGGSSVGHLPARLRHAHHRLRGSLRLRRHGAVSNVASRLCDEAKPGQILISPRVLTKVENAVKVEPVGEFELKGIRRPLAAYNVVAVRTPLP